MDLTNLAFNFGISILIGALIGIEREKKKEKVQRLSSVGIRTNILLSLCGAISAFIGMNGNPWIFTVSLLGVIAFITASHIYLSAKHKLIGITTEISALLVFLLGALTQIGHTQIAVILAIIVTMFLSLSGKIHEAIKKIHDEEFFDTIKFAIITFIILPFLPNQNYDSLLFQNLFPQGTTIEIANPYKLWLIVVLLSGISFIGYILIKRFGGKKGLSLTSIAGGLYSSTATAITLAAKSKTAQSLPRIFVMAIIIANAMIIPRILIVTATLNAPLFNAVLIPLSLLFTYKSLVGLYLFKTHHNSIPQASTQFKTPFNLTSALKLSLLIILTLLVAELVVTYIHTDWYYLLAATMGLSKIDPIIITTAELAPTLISLTTAKNSILLAIFMNSIQKVGIIYFLGDRSMLPLYLKIIAGFALFTLTGLFFL